MLDEVRKLFERIVVAYLVRHLCVEVPDLAECQFGFWHGRSTITTSRVRDLTEEAVSWGGVMLAVFLDISNAFNTLPWSCVWEALHYHRVHPYLRRIVGLI